MKPFGLSRTSSENSEARRELAAWDIEYFCLHYLAHYFTRPLQDFHRQLLLARDGVWEVARGHGKSTCLFALLVHVALFGWRRFVVVVSDTAQQATAFVRRVRDELDENERIIEDFGILRGPQWTETSFTTRHGVRLLARGAGSAIRGLVHGQHRPDMVLVDDLENDEAVLTPERREKLYRWVTAALWNVGGPDGMDRLVVGTPLHLDSVLRRLPAAGWQHHRFPALDADGQPLWPEAYDAAALAAKRSELGSLAFAQEYLLQPLDDEAKPFRAEWIRYYRDERDGQPCPDHWWRFVYVDPAIGQKQGSDWFVATVVGCSVPGEPLEVRVLDQYAARISVADQVARVCDLAGRWRPMSIGIEANAYQDALRQTVTEHVARTGQQAHVVPITNTAAKKTRIMALSPRVEMGIVTFHQRQASLIAHMLDYPSVAHDDHEDSLAGAVQMVANTGRLSCR